MKNLTILIATYNAEKTIKQCLDSILSQKNSEYDLLIADGNSTDQTIEILESYKNRFPSFQYLSAPDKGIHDAINKLIPLVQTPYYLVLGADDYLYNNAVDDYNSAIVQSNCDLITFEVDTDKEKLVPKKNQLRFGQLAYISQHSVGVAIRKNLHDRVGLYDQKYFIGADAVFILSAINSGATIYSNNKTVGYYSTDGLSSVNYWHTFFEFNKIQLLTYKCFPLSFIMFLMKLIINYRNLKNEHDEYFKNLKNK